MTQLIGIADFKAAAKAGARPDGGVARASVGEPVAIEGSRKIRFCFSDGSIDRAGDRIDPQGWDLSNFRKNSVALWAHDASEPVIGRAEGVQVEGDRLMGDIDFVPPDIYRFADLIYRLVKGKYINAVSVGFLPRKYSFVESDDRPWGIDFEKQELMEISVVPIPCNPNALGEARAKGIDTRGLVEWAERVLDDGKKILIPRAELELLRKQAAEPKRSRRRDGDGMGESDPAAGGALVATCGRAQNEGCGLKDPQECAVHYTPDDDGEKTMTVEEIRKAVAAVVRAEIKKAKLGRKAEPDDDEDHPAGDDIPAEDHEKCVRMAHAHVKAAGALYEAAGVHHDAARACLTKAVDQIGNPEAEKGEDGEDGVDDHIHEAHEHMKSAEDLEDQAEGHHDKAEECLSKAVDNFANPEQEGPEKSQRAAARRVRAAARRQEELSGT